MPAPGTPVRNVPLVTQVVDLLRARIADGHWPVGDRIPGEIQLADELGVSRGTVREALRALAVVGLLEPRVGDGTYVRSDDDLASALLRSVGPAELPHVLRVREVIDSAAAADAAVHATAAQVRRLRTDLRTRDRACVRGDRDGYVAADVAFHNGVVEASGNPVLSRVYVALGKVLADSIERTATLPEGGSVGQLHHDLLDAIATHDRASAERVAGELIREVAFTHALPDRAGGDAR